MNAVVPTRHPLGPPGAKTVIHGGQLPPCISLGTFHVPVEVSKKSSKDPQPMVEVSKKSSKDPQPMRRCSLEVRGH